MQFKPELSDFQISHDLKCSIQVKDIVRAKLPPKKRQQMAAN